MDTLLFRFPNYKKSPINSRDKYLKSLSEKLFTNASRLEFLNYLLSIKTKYLLV